jgi:hypothetical protein
MTMAADPGQEPAGEGADGTSQPGLPPVPKVLWRTPHAAGTDRQSLADVPGKLVARGQPVVRVHDEADEHDEPTIVQGVVLSPDEPAPDGPAEQADPVAADEPDDPAEPTEPVAADGPAEPAELVAADDSAEPAELVAADDPAEPAEPEAADQAAKPAFAESPVQPDSARTGDLSDVEWREIKASFVDDPSASVERAFGIVERTIQDVVKAVRERHAHRPESAGGEARPDTEQLRQALLGYGSMIDELHDVADRLARAERPGTRNWAAPVSRE